MGSVTSTEEYLQEEFKRLNKGDDREYLVHFVASSDGIDIDC